MSEREGRDKRLMIRVAWEIGLKYPEKAIAKRLVKGGWEDEAAVRFVRAVREHTETAAGRREMVAHCKGRTVRGAAAIAGAVVFGWLMYAADFASAPLRLGVFLAAMYGIAELAMSARVWMTFRQ